MTKQNKQFNLDKDEHYQEYISEFKRLMLSNKIQVQIKGKTFKLKEK